MLSTIFGVLILVADVWAIANTIQSSTTTGKKLLWIIFILFFPIIGLAVWYFAGPRK